MVYCAQVFRTFFLALPLLNNLSLTDTLFARETVGESLSSALSVSLSEESVESPVQGPLWISDALWIKINHIIRTLTYSFHRPKYNKVLFFLRPFFLALFFFAQFFNPPFIQKSSNPSIGSLSFAKLNGRFELSW